jgi:DNA uptake protein ComE-like DNA-binding protein
MRKNWIALAAALALIAVTAPAGAQTTDKAKAAPAASATGAPAASAAPAASPAPATSAAPAASTPPARASKPKIGSGSKKNLVNLNAASAAQLKALPGGSDAEAARIIAGRPYGSKAFLLTNKVIDAARYEEIKALVVAGEPAKATAAKK